MAILINTQRETKKIVPLNGSDFKLEELQRYVGGLIEILNLEDGNVLVINEEGKLKDLDVNEVATGIWWLRGGGWVVGEELTIMSNSGRDWIVGDVVFCKSEEVL